MTQLTRSEQEAGQSQPGSFTPTRNVVSLDYESRLVLDLRAITLFNRVTGHLLVITLKRGEVFASLGEFALFHTLTNIPVDESTLGVHKIEFVGERGPCLSNGGGVGKHAARRKIRGEARFEG